MQGLQALTAGDVPNLDRGVGIAGHQDVVLELHATGQRLVTHQGVLALARLGVPDPDGRVQGPAHNVHPVKLKEPWQTSG